MTDPQAWDEAVVELTIGAVAHGGHCVSRAPDGRVVFVRHTLPGEHVRAVITGTHKGFLRADAIEILEASPDRVTPPCPWSGPDRCGGCDFQHASLPAQRRLKETVLREQLQRLGGLSADEVAALGIVVEPLPDDDGLGWRTRVQYTVDSTGRAGLLKHRSHEVVPVDFCRIAHPLIRAAAATDQTWPAYDGVDVVASAEGDMAVLGTRGRARTDLLGEVPAEPGRRRSTRQRPGRGELVSGPTLVRERAVGREWTLPPDAFWQVHPAAADTLARAVVELLRPRESERVWDLYGGAGLFAAAMAPHLGGTGRITVVESDPLAVDAARRCLADLTTVTVIQSDVERALANPRWRSVDLVVLDPPRSGAGRRVVEDIVARGPRAVAYVACDPAALARDVRTFRDHGWRLEAVRAYDLFPMTHHLESIALLTPASAPGDQGELAAS